MSSITWRRNSVLAGLAYAMVAVLAAGELYLTYLVFHPTAGPLYRAYYIDQTTTCATQLLMEGTYTLGTVVAFWTDGNPDQTRELKLCGWEGPVGDGTHSVGETSRLRFAIPQDVGALSLAFEMTAIEGEDRPTQRVIVSANGTRMGEIAIPPGRKGGFGAVIPAAALAAGEGFVDLDFDFPNAVSMSPSDNNTRKRAVKLLSVRLQPWPADPEAAAP